MCEYYTNDELLIKAIFKGRSHHGFAGYLYNSIPSWKVRVHGGKIRASKDLPASENSAVRLTQSYAKIFDGIK
jgi:hypothetical protein